MYPKTIMKRVVLFISSILITTQLLQSQTYTIVDAEKSQPISYATISFGNGYGLFADNDGVFVFSKKRYADIDSLYISALGYVELGLSTRNMPKKIRLTPNVDELQTVVINAEKKRKYSTKKRKPIVHDDYFKCWLPTVESEIAVFFPRNPLKPTKIESVFLPVKLEDSRSKIGKKQAFATLFKMHFYRNEDGVPGKPLGYRDVIFSITDQSKKNFQLDILDRNVFIPKKGIFIAIQVLGYTDKNGKLQHTKKYHEVETRKGIVKVSTTFRPLLPFTNTIQNHNTFTRRIFYKNRHWQRFDQEYSTNNTLIQSNHYNYGMGLKLREYER